MGLSIALVHVDGLVLVWNSRKTTRTNVQTLDVLVRNVLSHVFLLYIWKNARDAIRLLTHVSFTNLDITKDVPMLHANVASTWILILGKHVKDVENLISVVPNHAP
jgi:hypothetical protein